jgi:hypothetical protein
MPRSSPKSQGSVIFKIENNHTKPRREAVGNSCGPLPNEQENNQARHEYQNLQGTALVCVKAIRDQKALQHPFEQRITATKACIWMMDLWLASEKSCVHSLLAGMRSCKRLMCSQPSCPIAYLANTLVAANERDRRSGGTQFRMHTRRQRQPEKSISRTPTLCK